MFSNSRIALASMICILATLTSRADDPPLFSGPQVGERLSPLNVVLPYGEQRGKQVDFIEVADGKPTVLIMVNGSNRPAGSLARAVMQYTEMRSPNELFGGIVWLGEDRSDAEEFLLRTRGAWAISAPLGISVDGSEGPGSYGFNRNVNVTVIVAKDNRVTANFALIQPSMQDVPKILQEVVKQAGGTVPTPSEIQYLSLMALPELRLPFPLETASHQVELRRRFCALLAAADKADDAQVDAAAKTLETYVAENSDIRDQFENAVRLLSPSHKYYAPISQHAAGHIQRWQEAIGDEEE